MRAIWTARNFIFQITQLLLQGIILGTQLLVFALQLAETRGLKVIDFTLVTQVGFIEWVVCLIAERKITENEERMVCHSNGWFIEILNSLLHDVIWIGNHAVSDFSCTDGLLISLETFNEILLASQVECSRLKLRVLETHDAGSKQIIEISNVALVNVQLEEERNATENVGKYYLFY